MVEMNRLNLYNYIEMQYKCLEYKVNAEINWVVANRKSI